MTVLFVTSGDLATDGNLAVAQKILQPGDVAILAADATRQRLHQVLASHQGAKRLFLMAHGGEDHFVDSAGVQALNRGDVALCGGFRVFSWACHTGRSLGKHYATNGTTWWGYDTAITAPDDRDGIVDIFASMFTSVRSAFDAGVDGETTLTAIHDIKAACVLAEEKLFQLAPDDPYLISLISCCRNTWQHLRAWLVGVDDHISHPEAPPPSLF